MIHFGRHKVSCLDLVVRVNQGRPDYVVPIVLRVMSGWLQRCTSSTLSHNPIILPWIIPFTSPTLHSFLPNTLPAEPGVTLCYEARTGDCASSKSKQTGPRSYPFPVGFVQFSYSLVVQQMTMPMRAGTCLLFQSRRPIRLCNSFPQAKGYPIRFWLPSDETDGEWIASWPHLFADPWSAYLSRAIGGTCLFSAVLHPHPVLGILQLRLSYSRCTSYGIPLLRLPS